METNKSIVVDNKNDVEELLSFGINFKLIIETNELLLVENIELYCRDLTVEALQTMAKLLSGKSRIDISPDQINEIIRNQHFIKQTKPEHVINIDDPLKWIVFYTGIGHSYHSAGSIHFYLNRPAEELHEGNRSQHSVVLLHEISHMYGCLHSSEGIMSGESGTATDNLFYDDLSLSILNLTHPFHPRISSASCVKFKWLTSKELFAYCEDGIECIVLESNGEYADIICSEERLSKCRIDMSSVDQCIIVSGKRKVFHVPSNGRSEIFEDEWLL